MAANPPVAKTVVARIMAAMAVRWWWPLEQPPPPMPPVSNQQLLGSCCIGLQETLQPRVSAHHNNNNQRAGNAASTSYKNDSPVWHLDSSVTDHLTSDLARLHLQERYGGADHVQVANGAGLSIAHVGHSSLAGSSIHLKNILHVPHLAHTFCQSIAFVPIMTFL
jgi:hypothetical protein